MARRVHDDAENDTSLLVWGLSRLADVLITTGIALVSLAFVWVVLVVTPARRLGKVAPETRWYDISIIWANISRGSKLLISTCVLGLVVSFISSISGADPGVLGMFSSIFGILFLVSLFVCCGRCCCSSSASSSSSLAIRPSPYSQRYYQQVSTQTHRIHDAYMAPSHNNGAGRARRDSVVVHDRDNTARGGSAPPTYGDGYRASVPPPTAPPAPPGMFDARMEAMRHLHADPSTFLAASAAS